MRMEPDGSMNVQWGTASNVDTTTGPTGATPLPKPQQKDSTSASVAGPSCSPFGSLTAGKQGYLVQVTNEQLGLADVWPVRILPPEVAAVNRTIRLAEAKVRIAGITARLALAPAALHPIIELHCPTEDEECQGCDGGPDYSGDWPCRTIELILEGL